MKIVLPENNLYPNRQEIYFEKVTALIGENGAGKSSILQSIFYDCLQNRGGFDNKKIVCFSSGQNEKYSKIFSEYLAKERQANRGLSLGCCYYDKLWSKILIFIATMIKNGYVRTFLKDKNYIEQSLDERDDLSTILNVSIRVEKAYVNRIQDALVEEENGHGDTFRTSPYHLTLESFIHTIIDKNYEFDEPLPNQIIKLSFENFFNPSFADPDEKFFGPIIAFFTQAADNDYFFDKNTTHLAFKNGLSINDLSDGEYQILFLYALIDLFDSEETFFLLDEVDSHLHYKNVELLWKALHSMKGYTLTTTHLLDSITSPLNRFGNLKIVNKGMIQEERKIKSLFERLSVLSRMESVQFEIFSKLDNIVLIDDYNDWTIFLALAQKKGLDISILSNINVIKKSSGYGCINEEFGKAKIDWVDSLLSFNSVDRKNIFLICDKDNAEMNFCENGVSVSIDNQVINKYKNKKIYKNIKIHVLAWKRREIKNYLLSFSALSNYGSIKLVNNSKIARDDFLKRGKPSDNRSIRNMNVKDIVTKLIDTEGIGLDLYKLNQYVNMIPSSEISEDIENMYNFLKSELK
ncbi:AAA family ATPase [Acinetobacter radioresistens]|uniref:AAA family ATPase n=1 Tax=Acinetobacter radioresistens TaxID=40216 RepID=UPI0020060939|nr:AAA family ATPase [Acinetobacter radioresistens]MCK4107719.1 ATP-binding protein [Acinetobacter radioresistens]